MFELICLLLKPVISIIGVILFVCLIIPLFFLVIQGLIKNIFALLRYAIKSSETKKQIQQINRIEQYRKETIERIYPSNLLGIYKFKRKENSKISLFFRNNTIIDYELVDKFYYQQLGLREYLYYAIKSNNKDGSLDASNIFLFRVVKDTLEYVAYQSEYNEVWNYWVKKNQQREQAIANNYPSYLIGIDEFIIKNDSIVSLLFNNDTVIDYKIVEEYYNSGSRYIILKENKTDELQSDNNAYLFRYEQKDDISKISYIDSVDEYKKVFNAWNEYHKDMDEYYNSKFYSVLGYDYEYVKKNRGVRGEYLASLHYDDIKTAHYSLLSVYIPTQDEIGSTEIDSIIITEAGLYVLEVKNREGFWEIEDDEAYIIYHREKKKVENPLKQNRNHIDALSNYILNSGDKELINAFEMLEKRVIGYVIFVRNSEVENSIFNIKMNKIQNRISVHDQIGNKISCCLAH